MQTAAPQRTSNLTLITFLLLLLVILFLLIRDWPSFTRPHTEVGDPTATPREITPRGNLDDEEKTNITIFKRCSPSSVHVQTFANVRRDPYSYNVLKIPQGSGTGIIWDDKGRIVTNYHVVSTAKRADGTINPALIQVTLADHTTYNVLDVNFAVDKDLAVLWIDAPKDRLQVVSIGESKNLEVGQKVFAIGNPFGLDQSLTTGIISAVGRDIQADESGTAIRGLIQTDAAINPGNSGGPLLDSAGRLIGVNTAIVSPSGASAGIGFAIPIDQVNQVVTQLIRRERRVRPALGIFVASDQLMQRLEVKGVLVMGLIPDGPAARAGLQATVIKKDKIAKVGDIIVAIDGKDIASTADLFTILEAHYRPEQEVILTVLRDVDGERMRVDVPLKLSGSGATK